eukprot:Lankesteria_metandrocarpae@DN2728_c0_g1_i1.p1
MVLSSSSMVFWVLVVVLVYLSVSTPSTATDDEVLADRVALAKHSFEGPLNAESMSENWMFGGAAVPTKSSVVLLPHVGNRMGSLWAKTPLKTAEFEIEFTFSIKGPPNPQNTSKGLAFWYLYDEPQPYPEQGADMSEWSLLGGRNHFNGVGVFFSYMNRDNQYQTAISITQDGVNTEIDLSKSLPTEYGVYYPRLRNEKEPIVFKLVVRPHEITGHIRPINSKDSVECFRVPPTNMRPGGYIGWSAENLDGEQGNQLKHEKVVIEKVAVQNLDLSKIGEDIDMIKDTLSGVNVGSLLSGKNDLAGLTDVGVELRQLTRLLFKHISEQQPRELRILRQLASQQRSVDALTEELRELKQQTMSLTSGKKPQEVVNQVTNELQGLRNLFHSHSRHQENLQESLTSLQKTIGGPQELSAALEATIKQQAAFSSWMIFGVIIMIAMFAIFVWKRMRDMEKKHFL